MVRAMAVALALAVARSAAGEDQGSSSLRIVGPAALLDGSEAHAVEHRSALFGSSDFGANTVLLKVVVDSDPNWPVVSEPKPPACSTDGATIEDDEGPALVIENGYVRCNFVRSALNAQYRRAQALLRVEDRCLESDYDKHGEDWKKYCQSLGGLIKELDLVGGDSKQVNIPTLLISHYEGMRLIECQQMAAGQTLEKPLTGVSCAKGDFPQVEIKWNIPQKDKVEFEVWTSSLVNADLFVKKYWDDKILPHLIDKMTFRPHYFVWDGNAHGCRPKQGMSGGSMCQDACHNKGRYCHFDPDGLGYGKIEGYKVSQENVRQLCIFNKHQDDQMNWWRYISCVAERCAGGNVTISNQHETYFEASCSEECHKQVGISWSDTQACIDGADVNGYGMDDDNEIKLLQDELTKRKTLLIERLPTAIVNGRIVDFDTSVRNTLSAICSGFERESRPDFCQCILSVDRSSSNSAILDECFGDPVEPSTPVPGSGASGGGVSFGTFFLVLVFICGALVTGFLVMRRRDRQRLRSEFHEDVRNIMGEYMRMDQDGADDGHFGATATSRQQQQQDYEHVVELK